jgi:hypothetical protein
LSATFSISGTLSAVGWQFVAVMCGRHNAERWFRLAFYSGARGVLKVLAHLIEQGDYEELHETIRRHGRLIEKIQRRRPRARRH